MPKQLRKNSSDITYWFKISWMYKAPIAKIPTKNDFNLNVIFEKKKLIINKIPQYKKLLEFKSSDKLNIHKDNKRNVIKDIFLLNLNIG